MEASDGPQAINIITLGGWLVWSCAGIVLINLLCIVPISSYHPMWRALVLELRRVPC